MNLKYKAIFNIDIIYLLTIHVAIYFSGNHILKYVWIYEKSGLLMDFWNDVTTFVMQIKLKTWTPKNGHSNVKIKIEN
jgi:hypothetical protein